MPDSLLIPSGLTYNGEEANEILIRPIFLNHEIESGLNVMVDIATKRQLILEDDLTDIVQADDDCERNPETNSMSLSQKWIEPCAIKAPVDFCVNNLRQSFLEKMLKKGINRNDITGTMVGDYANSKLVKALKRDVFTLAWFSDTTSLNATLSLCTGIWPRLISAVAGTNGIGIKRVATLGPTLVVDEAISALRLLFDGQSNALDSIESTSKNLLCTREFYENYRNTLEERCCGDRGTILLENGSTGLTFRGVLLQKRTDWSDTIQRYGLPNPHRVLLSSNTNLILGTDLLSDTATLEMLYNPFSKKTQADAYFKIATQYAYDDQTVIAY